MFLPSLDIARYHTNQSKTDTLPSKENIEEDITQGPCLTDMVHDLDMYSSTENIIPEDVMNEFLRVSATENERMIAS